MVIRGKTVCLLLVVGLVGCDESLTAPTPVTPTTPIVPQDFTGQVLIATHVRSEGNLRLNNQPVGGVRVTIVTGSRAGDRVETDGDGHYSFPEFDRDEIHLRLEKNGHESKEAIVHRTKPTTLPDQLPLGYQGPQNRPGTVLISLEWPEYIWPLMDRIQVVPDLLLMSANVFDNRGRPSGYYAAGVVAVNDPQVERVMVHEICHAHQHAIVAPRGSGIYWVPDWEASLEGRAYKVARQADRDEMKGVNAFDTAGWDMIPVEESAEACSHWLRKGGDEWFKRYAPNRLAWAEEWLPKR